MTSQRTQENHTSTKRGPLAHRFLIFTLSGLLTVLLIYLLGFFMADLHLIPATPMKEIENKHIDPRLFRELEQFRTRLRMVNKQVSNLEEDQRMLRNSNRIAEETVRQLHLTTNLKLARQIALSATEQNALSEAQEKFFANQRQLQEVNDQIVTLVEEKQALQPNVETTEKQLEQQRSSVRTAFRKSNLWHSRLIAFLQLACLLPLFIGSVWILFKYHKTMYRPLLYALLFATVWHMFIVIHGVFPHYLFKYFAIMTAIVVTVFGLLAIIRLVLKPQREWLLRQYREAYNHRVCPVCAYPIKQGFWKELLWQRGKPIIPSTVPTTNTSETDHIYICPHCGTSVFEPCQKCGKTRHGLLPFCEHCGDEKTIEEGA